MTNNLFDNPIQDYNEAQKKSSKDSSGSTNVGPVTTTPGVIPKLPIAPENFTPGFLGGNQLFDRGGYAFFQNKNGEQRYNFDTSLFLEENKEFNFRKTNSVSQIEDNFRFVYGSFWVFEPHVGPKLYRSSSQNKPIKINSITQSMPPTSGVFGQEKHRITVESDPQFPLQRIFEGDKQYNEPIMRDRVEYIDSVFKYDSPIHVDTEQENVKSSFWLFDNVYNFFHKNYEDTVNNSKFSEKAIPNIYSLVDQTSTDSVSEKVSNHNTLSGALNAEFSRASQDKSEMGLFGNSRYLDDWSRFAFSARRSMIEDISRPYRNIFFRQKDIASEEYRRANNEYKELFPFYNRLRFTPTSDSRLSSLISEFGFESAFYQSFQSSSSEEQYQQVDISTFGTRGGIGLNTQFNVGREEAKVWDMDKWLKNLERGEESLADTEDFGGETVEITLDETITAPKIMKIIFNAGLMSKLEKIRKEKKRSYLDLLRGEPSYSEILFYKIDKYRVSGQSQVEPEPEQTIVLPNNPNLDILDYIDTQVKFRQKYQYDVRAVHFVVGNKYFYIAPDQSDPQKGKFTSEVERANINSNRGARGNLVTVSNLASFDVVNRASYWLVEQTLFKTGISSIQDDPPLFPDVSFERYQNNKKELLLTLRKQPGKRSEKPKVIEQGDQQEFPQLDEEIKFETDGIIKSHEIYRIEEEPNSYSDFSDGRKITLDTEIGLLDAYKDLTSFRDTLEPNKTYYYTFRSRDIHDLLSNPSPIYIVEMRVQNDLVVPHIEIKTLKELNEPQPKERLARQFVEFEPSFAQVLPRISNEGADLKEKKFNVVLGEREKKVWNKDYKLRVTSRATGKSMDINFTFTYDKRLSLRSMLSKIPEGPSGIITNTGFDESAYKRFERLLGVGLT